jgi:predicted O-methyltransferase YrrM
VIRILKKYIKFWFTAHNRKGFGIHSPFVFKLVTQIIHDYHPFYCFQEIESQRKKLLQNKQNIKVTDYGTGSKVTTGNHRKISLIAKYSLKPAKQAQLLFRLINYFEYKNILELGTSLGITSSYLAKTHSKAHVITLEGCPNISVIAKQTYTHLNIENITLITGNFNNTLPKAINSFESLDFVFFDGNHTLNATIQYFELCLTKIHNETLFVFDDIYLNRDMETAWEQIKRHPQVKVSLDLFHLGFVFFKKELHPQHFKVRF